MSLKIIKTGLLDTIQDLGRYGYQHQGINPGGAMDRLSAALANALLGKRLDAPVIEMHFPAPQMEFQKKTIICLTGADFSPMINGKNMSLYQPVVVNAGAVLSFGQKQKGARCYAAVLAGMNIDLWLNSYSTNLKAAVGGYKGRQLQKEDVITFAAEEWKIESDVIPLPWKHPTTIDTTMEIAFLPGPEWNWLTIKSQTVFLNQLFRLTPASDRMGYRLQGEALEQEKQEQLLSSGVNFGTLQLLPNGQLIVLMADHQTTGGYPRIANVISTHLPKLAQLNAGDAFQFVLTTVETAEEKAVVQQRYLNNLQNTCKLKLQNWLDAHRY